MKKLIFLTGFLLMVAVGVIVAILMEISGEDKIYAKVSVVSDGNKIEISDEKLEKIEKYVRYNLKILEIEDVHDLIYPNLSKAVSNNMEDETVKGIILEHVKKGIISASIQKIDDDYKNYSEAIEYEFFEEILEDVSFEEMIDFMVRYEYQVLKEEGLIK